MSQANSGKWDLCEDGTWELCDSAGEFSARCDEEPPELCYFLYDDFADGDLTQPAGPRTVFWAGEGPSSGSAPFPYPFPASITNVTGPGGNYMQLLPNTDSTWSNTGEGVMDFSGEAAPDYWQVPGMVQPFPWVTLCVGDLGRFQCEVEIAGEIMFCISVDRNYTSGTQMFFYVAENGYLYALRGKKYGWYSMAGSGVNLYPLVDRFRLQWDVTLWEYQFDKSYPLNMFGTANIFEQSQGNYRQNQWVRIISVRVQPLSADPNNPASWTEVYKLLSLQEGGSLSAPANITRCGSELFVPQNSGLESKWKDPDYWYGLDTTGPGGWQLSEFASNRVKGSWPKGPPSSGTAKLANFSWLPNHQYGTGNVTCPTTEDTLFPGFDWFNLKLDLQCSGAAYGFFNQTFSLAARVMGEGPASGADIGPSWALRWSVDPGFPTFIVGLYEYEFQSLTAFLWGGGDLRISFFFRVREAFVVPLPGWSSGRIEFVVDIWSVGADQFPKTINVVNDCPIGVNRSAINGNPNPPPNFFNDLMGPSWSITLKS